MIMDW